MPLSDLDVSWFWRFLKGSQTIGTCAFIHQVFQGQQLPNASKVQEWMAYNEFRQYCQSQFDKGILWDDCNNTLALPMKAPPLTNTETFLQNEKLFSRSHPLAERTAASMQVDPEHDHNSVLSNLDLDAEAHAQSSSANITSSRTQRHQPGSTSAAMAQDMSMHVATGYLPLMVLAIVLLYICLYTLVKRLRLSRQPRVKGLFKRHFRVHSSTRIASLSLFAAEDLELGYGERHSVGDQIINEIMGTSGCSADVDIDGAMATHLR